MSTPPERLALVQSPVPGGAWGRWMSSGRPQGPAAGAGRMWQQARRSGRRGAGRAEGAAAGRGSGRGGPFVHPELGEERRKGGEGAGSSEGGRDESREGGREEGGGGRTAAGEEVRSPIQEGALMATS